MVAHFPALAPAAALLCLGSTSAVCAEGANPVPAFELVSNPPDEATAWSLRGLDRPTFVLYDSANDVIYVSNMQGDPQDRDGKGFISQIDPSGTPRRLRWIEGLDAPRGMAIHGDYLIVADINELVAVDTLRAQVSTRHIIPGAQLFADVAAAADGTIYAADQGSGAIRAIKDGLFVHWLEDDRIREPSRLRLSDDHLIVISRDDNGRSGKITTVTLENKAIEELKTIKIGANLTAFAPDGEGNHLATDGPGGRLLRIGVSGEIEVLHQIASDTSHLALMRGRNLVVITLPEQNEVRALRLDVIANRPRSDGNHLTQ